MLRLHWTSGSSSHARRLSRLSSQQRLRRRSQRLLIAFTRKLRT